MTVPMQAQFLLGLQSILLGASLGLFYDILRAFRVVFLGRAPGYRIV